MMVYLGPKRWNMPKSGFFSNKTRKVKSSLLVKICELGPNIWSIWLKLKVIGTNQSNSTQNSNFFTNKVDFTKSAFFKTRSRGHIYGRPRNIKVWNENWGHLGELLLWRHQNPRTQTCSKTALKSPLKFRFWPPTATLFDFFKVYLPLWGGPLGVPKEPPTVWSYTLRNPVFGYPVFYLVKIRGGRFKLYRGARGPKWCTIFDHPMSLVESTIGHIWTLRTHFTTPGSLRRTAC